jgi:hypothetical protein
MSKRHIIFATVLAVSGGAVVASAQQQAQEPTYTIQLRPSRGLTIGALLEEQKCTVKEFASGTCAPYNAYSDINEQVNKQNTAAVQSQRDAFEKSIREKVAKEAVTPPEPEKAQP